MQLALVAFCRGVVAQGEVFIADDDEGGICEEKPGLKCLDNARMAEGRGVVIRAFFLMVKGSMR